MSNTIIKTLTTLVSWAFYLGLSFCFMRAWVQVTPGGIAWLVVGVAVSGVMCALVARS
jgi:hypothetical protein